MEHLAGDNQFFTARRPHVATPGVPVPSAISKWRLELADASVALIGTQEEENRFRDRIFLHSFSNDLYVYFVFKLAADSSSVIQLRISRICKSEQGNGGRLSTYTEALLECSIVSGDYFSGTSVRVNGSVFVISAGYNEQLNENQLCLFSLAEIDLAMDQKFNDCILGLGRIGLKRDSSSLINCPQFSDPAQIEVSSMQ